jgi:hypothetical protein
VYLDVMYSFYFVFSFGFVDFAFIFDIKSSHARAYSVLKDNAKLTLVFFVWVWGVLIAHYTGGFGFVCFFGLGCFPVVVCVWGVRLCHTVNMDAMLKCVSVSVKAC